jgi:hypothetical protein
MDNIPYYKPKNEEEAFELKAAFGEDADKVVNVFDYFAAYFDKRLKDTDSHEERAE